jgi:uncharacterized lipoprotein YddW (UPF0748 family)
VNKTYHGTDRIICHYDSDRPVEIPDTLRATPVRGLWVSNVANIDLPVIEGDGAVYKDHIERLFEVCEDYAINTLYFQVRTTNDAFYRSVHNPWSRFLTGTEGQEPPFDVLAWVIEEAHKRGIELHGWCNPYRVSFDGSKSLTEYLETCDDKNLAKQDPSLVLLDKKGKLILNPADPRVKRHIIDSMVELAQNYDIDGIHFDDYFYPYHAIDDVRNDLTFYDQREDRSLSLDDFRRQQVNDVIEGVHTAIHALGNEQVFGVSPFGIWKNKDADPNGSNTAPQCGQSYFNQYADSVRWVKEGWVDYIVPQIYFPFGHPIAPFADLVDFWVGVVRNTDVDLYIGHGAYRLGSEGEWLDPDEVVQQLRYANQFPHVSGNVFFTYHNFRDAEEKSEGILRLRAALTSMID